MYGWFWRELLLSTSEFNAIESTETSSSPTGWEDITLGVGVGVGVGVGNGVAPGAGLQIRKI